VTTPPEGAPGGTPGGVPDSTSKPSDAQLPGKEPPAAGEPAGEPAPDDQRSLPARRGEERLEESVARTGMFGVTTTGDTSGYGRLVVHRPPLPAA
jgi:hypothetical protein